MVSPTTEAEIAELFSDMGKTHSHCQLNLGASILSTFWAINHLESCFKLLSLSFIHLNSGITVRSHILPKAGTSNP
jgi:hypothetical protein